MATPTTAEPAPVEPVVDEHVDEAGRRFGHALVTHPGAEGLGIHFSAFFGAWGNARAYRDTFQGYFHRLKMLGSHPGRNWLFLCDSHGVNRNGTYYLGERGDLYVERAMHDIIDTHLGALGLDPSQVVTVGSSMGGTAALKFGLRYDVAGILAIGPHIDLDTSALRQDRMTEVAWALPDGEVASPANHPLTRHVRRELAARSGPPPDLFVQSCEDDAGVHAEQVLPLVTEWRAKGGIAHLDARPEGGHTSAHAPRALLVDVVDHLLDGDAIDVAAYGSDPRFSGPPTRIPWSHRVRGVLKLRTRARALRDLVQRRPSAA